MPAADLWCAVVANASAATGRADQGGLRGQVSGEGGEQDSQEAARLLRCWASFSAHPAQLFCLRFGSVLCTCS